MMVKKPVILGGSHKREIKFKKPYKKITRGQIGDQKHNHWLASAIYKHQKTTYSFYEKWVRHLTD